MKDIDRQYERNNNQDLDNGVFNEFVNRTDTNGNNDEEKKEDTVESNRDFMNMMHETEEDEDEVQG